MNKLISFILVLTMAITLGMASASCSATPSTPGASTPTSISSPTGTVSTTPGTSATPTATSSSPNTGTGTVQFFVTDAPPAPDVTSILVTVSKIEVHMVEPGEETATPTPTSTAESEDQTEVGNTSWTNVSITGPETFDLLKIKGIEQSLASQAIEPGKYTQVRLTIDKVEVALNNGTPEEATLPSGVLKFVHPFDVQPGETTAILMDFNAAASVNVNGNGNIIVKPVIQLSTQPANSNNGNNGATPTNGSTATP